MKKVNAGIGSITCCSVSESNDHAYVAGGSGSIKSFDILVYNIDKLSHSCSV